MRPSGRLRSLVSCTLLALLAATPSFAADGSGLTRVNGPQGGVVVYGPTPGEATTAAAAMGAVLKALHQQFSVRPEVGRVFELRDSDSIAVHFVLRPTNAPARGGMIVIARNGRGGFEAGVVSDETTRLQTSFNPMLQALFAAWHPTSATPMRSQEAAAPVPPLRPFMLPDRSAAAALPDGWTVRPNSGGGSIFATGPHGEKIALGYAMNVIDTSVPAGRQLQRQAMGPLRNTSYAKSLYYPFGQPPGKTYVDLIRMARALAGLPATPIRLVNEESLGRQGEVACTHLRGEIADESGPAALDSIFCVSPPERSANTWMTLAYTSTVPVAQADAQRATLAAIVASFRQDQAVIQRQANQYAAPGIAQIREIGRLATQRAADADRTRIAMRQSYEARQDSQNRSSRAFSNYIRDQTVVVDRTNNAHETLWNKSADSLVESDPKRFGYVNTPNFWKGVDY